MNILKLSYDFSKKYTISYIQALIKPIGIGFIGILFFCFIFTKSYLVLLALVSIPFMCWGFWKGFVVTYGLCDCAGKYFEYKSSSQIQNNKGKTIAPSEPNRSSETEKSAQVSINPPIFADCLKTIDEKDFGAFVAFFAIATVILYIPSFIYTSSSNPFSLYLMLSPKALAQYALALNKALFINTIALSPFLNFALQAYYFKKEDENYFNLFFNCYKKLDLKGIIIAVLITVFTAKLTEANPLIYLICALFFNMFIYSINTFWYLRRVENQTRNHY